MKLNKTQNPTIYTEHADGVVLHASVSFPSPLEQSPGQRQSPEEQHTSLAVQHTPVGVGSCDGHVMHFSL